MRIKKPIIAISKFINQLREITTLDLLYKEAKKQKGIGSLNKTHIYEPGNSGSV